MNQLDHREFLILEGEAISRRSDEYSERFGADWSQVDQILGRTTTTQPDGVRRYGFPRSDLTVTSRGIALKAEFALGGYASFTLSGSMDAAMVMGDLVLTEDEINPVMIALQEGGVETTAIHNHLLFETPRIMYLHFKGEGDPAEVAEVLYTALSTTNTPLVVPTANATSPALPFNTTALDSIMGYPGKNNAGVYQYNIGRAEAIMDGDTALYTRMGTATIINFQPVGDTTAAVTGDFSLIATEVPLVLRALSENGIQVNALHSHMLTDSPRLFYVHFWGVDDATVLARGLREPVSLTNSARPGV
ncbi:uncharacterized protein DNG_09756 [Cephalotrichum gorgonifer]|uniref:DUF1259 domain-containing protein n=1 Tax=Cephalotrichum gorgonifer TaxID=2041049 RepID=A0AAE8N8L4_9PEZI|nr:uncharacterized protein DNG_09756 [Cephalotrichum gorgonifer]